MTIPKKIEELAHKIRTAIYGKDVREALASGIEAAGETAENARKKSEETASRQTELETRFEQQIQNMTLEDPSSAEIVDARGGETLLRHRLDKVDARLAQTETDISNRVRLKKIDTGGGQFPQPLRVPTLNTKSMFPTKTNPYYPLWVKGKEIYAYGKDHTLRKSVDEGKTWEVKGNNARGFSITRCFLKTSTGTLLAVSGMPQQEILRSTDDGMTWEVVFTLRNNTVALGTQSWAIDEETGYIYFGEYNTAELEVVNLYRSTDDGLTWDVFHSFRGGLASGDHAKIKHIHAVQWDHVDKRIVICTGDGTDYTGLWRVNATGDGIEKILTNDMLPSKGVDIPRCIGIMPFDDYIAWAGDTTLHPYIFRIKRSEIGTGNINVERIYRLNSTAWFTCRASNDGSVWVVSASNEGSNSIDNLVHLYAVEDQGETVWEIGSIPADLNASAGSLMPVGLPQNHNENFYLTTRNFTDSLTWGFRLGKGFNSIPVPEPLPNYVFPQTVSTSGEVTLTAGEEKLIGITRAGTRARCLNILEAFIMVTERGGVSPAYQRLIVRRENGEELFSFQNSSERRVARLDFANEIAKTGDLPNGETVYIFVKNIHHSVTIKVVASLTFAWG